MPSGSADSYAGGGSGSSADVLALAPELELAGAAAGAASSWREQPAATAVISTNKSRRVVVFISCLHLCRAAASGKRDASAQRAAKAEL